MTEELKAKLVNLPHLSGSYQMKDKFGEIIYVGKAKDLHNRVNSYFVGAHDFKTQKLVSEIVDFDFIITSSEKEALVLEINLIKKNRPKFNIQFIDDSSYPYIKLTKEKYPRLSIARDLKKDRKAKYFGPFPDAFAAKNTLKVLQSLYPFRRCNKMHDKLCLYYHMNQCLGPCVYDIPNQTFIEMADGVRRFLAGDIEDVTKKLTEQMYAASEKMEYEKAQEYKELIDSIHRIVSDKQNIELDHRGNRDVFACYYEKGYLSITGFLVRNGTVLSKEFRLRPLYGDLQEEFDSFILQFYDSHPSAKELVLPKEMDISALEELLDFPIIQPQKGYKRKLIEMCEENAKKQLQLK
ncbi:MAG: excinuclease ABC subunit C, partial [Solobacterium sp.]|nr:excinuclease ABC subunit C [Solobacterium sp.]